MNYFVFVLFIAFYPLGKTSEAKTLEMVHLVYRHGHRSPIYIYPKDPYQENTSWPDGLGRLTQIGMNMEYDLGKFLKSRYINQNSLVNSSYLYKEVYIRSSDVERCLQSAETQLAGFYPPKGYQVWNTAIPWQPVPVHTVPADEDAVLRPGDTVCPRLFKLEDDKKREPIYLQKQAQYNDFMKQLSNYTGMLVNFDNLWEIGDALVCEKVAGFKIPSWAQQNWKKLLEITKWVFLNQYKGSDELGRLLGGTLLGIMNDNMEKRKEGKYLDLLKKLYMFSGHDTSILSLTAALDIEMSVPTFASCMMVELYKDSGNNYFVEIHYRNDSSGSTYLMKLKECDYQCPLAAFLSLTKNRVPTNREKECNFPKKTDFFTVHRLKIASLLFIITTVLFLIIIIILCIRRRAYSTRRMAYKVNGYGDDESLIQEMKEEL